MSYETRCVRIRLKPGSLGRVREWTSTINSQVDEALATLRDEGVIIECVFLDSSELGDFLIYFMKAESFEAAASAATTSGHAIDDYHRRFTRDTWLERSELETLIDLDRIDEFIKK